MPGKDCGWTEWTLEAHLALLWLQASLPLPLPTLSPSPITCMGCSLPMNLEEVRLEKEGGRVHTSAGALGLAAPSCPFSNY